MYHAEGTAIVGVSKISGIERIEVTLCLFLWSCLKSFFLLLF